MALSALPSLIGFKTFFLPGLFGDLLQADIAARLVDWSIRNHSPEYEIELGSLWTQFVVELTPFTQASPFHMESPLRMKLAPDFPKSIVLFMDTVSAMYKAGLLLVRPGPVDPSKQPLVMTAYSIIRLTPLAEELVDLYLANPIRQKEFPPRFSRI